MKYVYFTEDIEVDGGHVGGYKSVGRGSIYTNKQYKDSLI